MRIRHIVDIVERNYSNLYIVMIDILNTMENNQNNNTNDFMPTKELGDLAKYASVTAFGVKNMRATVEKHTHLSHTTIGEIFEGTWSVKSDYIRLLALCISRIRPMKVKFKNLPVTLLPNRDVLESLERGLEEDLALYTETIKVLGRMPDIASKKPNSYSVARSGKSSKSGKSGKRTRITLYKGEDFRASSLYRQISAQNSSIYNNGSCSSDFEYGLTDT